MELEPIRSEVCEAHHLRTHGLLVGRGLLRPTVFAHSGRS